MLAAGTAKGDGEVALSLCNVVGQEEQKHIGGALKELRGLRELADVGGYPGMFPREPAKLRYKVGIRQEADVEDQIGFQRNPVLESEADAGDQQILLRAAAFKLVLDGSAQLMHVEVCRIQIDVGEVAHRVQQLALGAQCANHGVSAPQRMGTACLRVTAQEHGVGGVQKKHPCGQSLADLAQQ